ncbi:MAG: TorF family putative porin [Opitutaceae bacterium]
MKKALVLGLAAVASIGVARAQYSISTDITFASDYIFRGIQLSENTLHPSIEISSDQFYLGYWGAFPINNTESKGWVDEYDFYAGFNQQIGETTAVDVGLTHYYYTQLDSTTEAYVGLTGDVGGMTPGVYVYYDFDLQNLTVQGSVGYSLPLENAGTSLDLSATVGYVEPDMGDSYAFYGASAVIPFQVNENATISVGLHYSQHDISEFALADLGQDDDNFLYGTIGLTLGF